MVIEKTEKRFGLPIWDERMEHIRNYFRKVSLDSEEIAVTADVNVRTNAHKILITYMCIRNKKAYVRSIGIDPALLEILSHHATHSVMEDILQWFRTDDVIVASDAKDTKDASDAKDAKDAATVPVAINWG